MSILNAIEAAELENLIKLNVAKGKACSTLGKAKEGAEAMQSALDVSWSGAIPTCFNICFFYSHSRASIQILQYSPCADSEHFDRSVSFPIFSGLFVVLKMGAIQDDEECSYEKDLTEKFVEQTRLNKDPVHYGRALAMQGETLGRLGLFERALESLERINMIYDIETQHEAICKSYGSDRVAQAYAHSVNWNMALGRNDEVVRTCKYIIEELAPKSDPKNVHNSFCLLYSTMIAMKENGASLEARDAFLSFIVEPFDEHFGKGGTTFSKPLFVSVVVYQIPFGHFFRPV